LVRWYPAVWRARYGVEFAALLAAEFAERPRCWRRTADVVRGGLAARLAAAGLGGHPLDPAAARRAGLAACVCSLATFAAVAAALWAQLAVGWQWAPPGSPAVAAAMTAMSAAMMLLACLALAGLGWLARAALRGPRGERRALARPAALVTAGALVLVVGGRHFGNGWPGTGGHWWPHQGVVPGGLAAFTWACTLWASSYWAHPAALASFPAAQIAWMVISPAALASLTAGLAGLVRRVPGRAGGRWPGWYGAGAAAGMALFLAGAGCWLAAGTQGPHGLFHTGAIDAAGLAVMAAALIVGGLALQQIRRARPAGAARR
jgi:hypothetical protein